MLDEYQFDKNKPIKTLSQVRLYYYFLRLIKHIKTLIFQDIKKYLYIKPKDRPEKMKNALYSYF